MLTNVGLCGNIQEETTQNKMFCKIQGGEEMQNEYEIKKEMCEIGRLTMSSCVHRQASAKDL